MRLVSVARSHLAMGAAKRIIGVWLYGLSTLLVLMVPALAKAAPGNTADEEFRAGMALMKEGLYAEACQRLEASLRLDAGMAAHFRLAECYERLGHFASAWDNYREVATAAGYAGMPERERFARERGEAIRPRVSWLVIRLPREVASRTSAVVTRNDEVVPRARWGQPIAVDPGVHRIQVRAGGYPAWETSAEAPAPGATVTVTAPAAQGRSAERDEPSSAADGDSPDSIGGQAVAGVVVTAVGVVALGVGTGFGVASVNTLDEADAECPDQMCSPLGRELVDEAGAKADVSTALFIVGGAALVGGLVVWLTAPSGDDEADADVAPQLGIGVGPGSGSLQVRW